MFHVDTASDVGVIVNWFLESNDEIDTVLLAILSCVILGIYRIISALSLFSYMYREVGGCKKASWHGKITKITFFSKLHFAPHRNKLFL